MRKLLLLTLLTTLLFSCKKDDKRFKIEFKNTFYGANSGIGSKGGFVPTLANVDTYIIISDFDVKVVGDNLLFQTHATKLDGGKFEYKAFRDVHEKTYKLTVTNTNNEVLTYTFKGRAGTTDDW